MRKLLTLFFSVSLLFSCDDNNDCDGFNLETEFEIVIDETLHNCPNNIAITLLNIQDSRCPTGAQCIWQGMILIEGILTIDGKDYQLNLSTEESFSGYPVQFSTEEYSVKLIDAFPYPNIIDSSSPEDKRAILTVSKRST